MRAVVFRAAIVNRRLIGIRLSILATLALRTHGDEDLGDVSDAMAREDTATFVDRWKSNFMWGWNEDVAMRRSVGRLQRRVENRPKQF